MFNMRPSKVPMEGNDVSQLTRRFRVVHTASSDYNFATFTVHHWQQQLVQRKVSEMVCPNYTKRIESREAKVYYCNTIP